MKSRETEQDKITLMMKDRVTVLFVDCISW